ncbi:MAG: hypothetical protein AAFN79_04070 [Pseudomonadota bacterium]
MRFITKSLARFTSDKSGAVTVDWVALTAAVVVVGIALVYAIFGNDTTGFNGVAAQITTEATALDTTIENANVQANAPSVLGGGGS